MLAPDSRDPLDEAIDGAARSMTAVTPPPALRPAVRARLVPPSVAALSPGWRWCVAAAAIVLLMMATDQWVTVRRDTAITGPVSSPSRTAPVTSAPLTASAPDRTAAPEATATPRALAPTLPQEPRASALGDRRSNDRADSMPALAMDAPVQVDGSTMPPIVTGDPAEDAIVVEALTFEPMPEEIVEIELIETPMPLRAEWVEIEPQSFERGMP